MSFLSNDFCKEKFLQKNPLTRQELFHFFDNIDNMEIINQLRKIDKTFDHAGFEYITKKGHWNIDQEISYSIILEEKIREVAN